MFSFINKFLVFIVECCWRRFFRFTGVELVDLGLRFRREYFICVKRFVSWRFLVMCVCEGGRVCVRVCIGIFVCTFMSSIRVYVREEERLGKGRGRVFLRIIESLREQVRCRYLLERVTFSKGGIFQILLDYLVEIEFLRGGKK